MAIFTLKRGDTRPVLEVALKNPDGTPHNLTGSTEYKLHVRLGSSIFTRDMDLVLATAGTLRYTFVETDWDAPDGLPTVAAGKTKDLPMEYEVVGAGDARMTFPNGSNDTLRIVGDLA